MTDLRTELKRSQKLASKAIFNKNLDSYDDFKKFLRLYLVQEALKPSSVAMIDRNSRFYQDWNDQTRAKCDSTKSIPDLIPFFKRFAKETKLDLNIVRNNYIYVVTIRCFNTYCAFLFKIYKKHEHI